MRETEAAGEKCEVGELGEESWWINLDTYIIYWHASQTYRNACLWLRVKIAIWASLGLISHGHGWVPRKGIAERMRKKAGGSRWGVTTTFGCRIWPWWGQETSETHTHPAAEVGYSTEGWPGSRKQLTVKRKQGWYDGWMPWTLVFGCWGGWSRACWGLGMDRGRAEEGSCWKESFVYSGRVMLLVSELWCQNITNYGVRIGVLVPRSRVLLIQLP